MTRDEVVGVNAALDLYPVGSIVRDRVREMGRVYFAYLDAPERDMANDDKDTWGTCPVCLAPQGHWCVVGHEKGNDPHANRFDPHPERLAAAPLRVRLVAVKP